MKISARDIAQALGTSTASISRAFRPDTPMSEDLRRKILSKSQELGYIPPGGRVSRKMGRMSVSLVVGDIRNPYYASVMDEFSQVALDKKIEIFFHIVPPGKTVDATMQQVFAARTDGVIVTSVALNSTLARQCQQRGLPVVLFGRVQIDTRLTAISGDNYNGARAVAKRFIEAGRQRIAFMGGTSEASTHLERRRGFLDMLEEAGMPLQGEYSGAFHHDTAQLVAEEWATRPDRPDAVFCVSDFMAFGVMDGARSRGLVVPDDLAVVGFDDVPMAAWPGYSLTTVRQRVRLMVREALSTLTDLIDDPGVEGSIKITPCHIVERESG